MEIHWSIPVWMWPLLLVVAAGAVVFTVSIYRRSRPLPPERLRRWLTALRAVARVLLVAAIAGPVFSRLHGSEEPAQLVVVVEDSASMAIADQPTADAGSAGRSRWDWSLDLAAGLPQLKGFHYVSTLAVAGDHPGHFSEDDLDVGQDFDHAYGKSKYQAEKLVKESGLPATVYRPGVVVGDSRTGEMDKVDGPYYFFRLMKLLGDNLRFVSLSKGAKRSVRSKAAMAMTPWMMGRATRPD